MALTTTEEQLVRQLLAEQSAILSLASSESEILSNLGGDQATLSDLAAATALADADLMLVRQGTTDKSVTGTKIKELIFNGAETPAQFDDDTSVATTAFVQRSLGNARGFVQLSANTTLSASHVGMEVYAATSSGTITLTLPSATALKSGAKFKIFNTGVSDVIVARAGTNTIVVNNTTNTVTAVTLKSGDSIVLTSLGTGGLWYHGGGTAQLGSAGAFGASLTASGWQRMPSGLILQWAKSGTITAGQSGSVTWPIAFPNQCLFGISNASGGSPSGNPGNVVPGDVSIVGMSLHNWGVISASAMCFGIGR